MSTEDKGQTPQTPPQFKAVKVKVGGQDVEFTPQNTLQNELALGALRLEDYRKKTEDLARERQAFEQERENLLRSVGRPLAGPEAGYGGGGGWVPPQAVGGDWPSAGPTYPRVGQPAQGITSPPSGPGPAPKLDDEYPTGTAVRQYVDTLFGETREQMTRMMEEVRTQQQILHEERTIDETERTGRIPGFSRSAVEQTLRTMSPPERAAYMRMPKAAAYELIHYRQVAPLQSPQGQSPVQQTQEPPFMEGSQSAPQGAPEVPKGPLTRGNALQFIQALEQTAKGG